MGDSLKKQTLFGAASAGRAAWQIRQPGRGENYRIQGFFPVAAGLFPGSGNSGKNHGKAAIWLASLAGYFWL